MRSKLFIYIAGEGTMETAMLISGVILGRYILCSAIRRRVVMVLWSIAVVGMALRVMMGRHFLSNPI
jgi:hypothetical protein